MQIYLLKKQTKFSSNICNGVKWQKWYGKSRGMGYIFL